MFGDKVFKLIKTYLILTIGVFLYAFSWIAFIIPKGIAGGGVTGISSIIYYATDGLLPISLSYLVINVALITIGTIILGKGFGFKTIYCILCASLMFEVLPQFEWITTLSDIPDKFINAIIGGALSAFGIAAIFMQGGSTGGTDIIAIVLSKYRDSSPGKIFMYCDLIIIGSILVLPGKGLQDVVYGYIVMVSFTYLLDQLLTGAKQSVQIIIFSSKYKEIGDMLITSMDRGVTALDSVGWYSQQEGKVLIVIARKQQLPQITASIKEVDHKAFISVSSVMGVYGEGFEKVKARLKKDKKGGLMKFMQE
ncbi:MAG: YitT family protein [Bacteroidales bacterium]|nr:YitT family protein [Bacteroidales bacterium]MBP3344566.1 YitT family protein [Bacteroidales bacterium]MBQ6870956.1 YitT family protein [Bacteroidales bacterium]MBR4094964.1 YitT family protein [Bacteroidales bacterium]